MLNITLTGNQLTVSDFGAIRITEDGWLSIYDLIAVCSNNQKLYYPFNTWKRLCERYPETFATKKTNLISVRKFPGKGQRRTPVCTKEKALEILGLLPGAAGHRYREAAAKLVATYLTTPEALADLAVDRMVSQGDIQALERHKVRLEGKTKRCMMTLELSKRNVTQGIEFAQITNGMTKDITGQTATAIKVSRQVKNARDAMEAWELAALSASESLATALMIKKDSQGFFDCNSQCRKASQTIAGTLD